MTDTLNQLLADWSDPLSAHTLPEAEDLIHMLLVEIAGKEAIIKELRDDLKFYRSDYKDQMIQDQGLEQ